MTLHQLIHSNTIHYRRHYRLIAIAVCVATAVVVGSLMVGHSVRQTLLQRVDERLGKTETVVVCRQSFLSSEVLNSPLWEKAPQGMLLMNGFVSVEGRLIPVVVWGVDSAQVKRGQASVNTTLAEEMGATKELTLRLPHRGLVPSGSLFVSDEYTTSLRLECASIRSAEDGGNLSLKNEQVLPMNIFVCRNELVEAMGMEDDVVNILLSDVPIDETQWAQVWEPQFSGVKVTDRGDTFELTTSRLFLEDAVVEALLARHPDGNPLCSYLANSIATAKTDIPYSFVTAVKEQEGNTLQDDEMLLSDYAARRLDVKVGDEVDVSYYVSHDLKHLQTDSVKLRVAGIVPISRWVADSTLSAQFPGMTGVQRCSDWNSDLPLDMSRIQDEDERYWEMYRSVPKALLPYRLMSERWKNAYGTTTAIRFHEKPDLSVLQPGMFGIQLLSPRQAGLAAASKSIDFSSLFLALGFFIILSAILLMVNPLSEMYEERKSEFHLLQALGFKQSRIQRMLFREAMPVVVGASLIGVLVGLAYTSLILWLLGTVWSGVTGTNGFHLYINWTLALAFALVLALALIVPLLLLRGEGKKHPDGHSSPRGGWEGAFLFSLFTLLLIISNLLWFHSLLCFVVIGLLLLIVGALWGECYLQRKGNPRKNGFSLQQQTLGPILFFNKQALYSYFALSAGVFIVLCVGLNRQSFSDASRIRQMTGGYDLWCQSSVPIYHDMNTQEGRKKLGLTDLPDDVEVLQTLLYEADDASCLNLNRVEMPSVLGIPTSSPFISNENGLCIDEESLLWSMGKQVGDTINYKDGQGNATPLVIAESLPTSIFQGYALMNRERFLEIWPENRGTTLFLVKTKDDEREQVAQVLSQALNEYGVRVMTTGQRMAQFGELVNTYLSIFLTLGGIGMLIGIFSFIIVVRKNLLQRMNDLQLYQALGYSRERLESQLYHENIIVPLFAIGVGAVAAVISVIDRLSNASLSVWATAIFFTFLFVALVLWQVKVEVKRMIAN
jgi:putative ABC transport system permease protein